MVSKAISADDGGDLVLLNSHGVTCTASSRSLTVHPAMTASLSVPWSMRNPRQFYLTHSTTASQLVLTLIRLPFRSCTQNGWGMLSWLALASAVIVITFG